MESAGLPFSAACERNKDFILEVLQRYFPASGHVLELGSGTGQHAVFLARALPELIWQPTDTGEYLPGLRARVQTEAPDNVRPVVELDVRMRPWPVDFCDAVFSANTLHFMSKDCALALFEGVAQVLRPAGCLVVYGPFNYAGRYSSASNAQFDAWLRSTDPVRGIRDFEWINEQAGRVGLQLLADESMPANNRSLVWQHSSAA